LGNCRILYSATLPNKLANNKKLEKVLTFLGSLSLTRDPISKNSRLRYCIARNNRKGDYVILN